MFLFCSMVPSLVAFADELILFSDLVKRNNIFYEKSSKLPFSGQVKGRKNGRLVQGKINGLWITYLESGDLSYKANYKSGNLNGLWEKYHGNGRLSEEGTYNNGKKNRCLDYLF